MMKIITLFIISFSLCVFNFNANAAVASYSYSEMYMYDNQDCYQPNNQDYDAGEVSDPLKILNKQIFYFNAMLDTLIFAPVNMIYTTATPKQGRVMISNFMSNMGEPLNLINALLQGNFAQARVTFGRFITNSLLGLGGIFDPASGFGLKYMGEDFGQTMARYGAGTGVYLVAPILGPTNLRDLTGKVADYFMDPFKYTLKQETREIISIVWLLQKRSDGDSIIQNIRQSLDPYETAKQMYIQYRKNQIQSGQVLTLK